jgi:hypothetical protein
MVDWTLIASIVIILFIILVIWARVSGQTILELFADIRDFIGDKKDSTVEVATQVYE